MISINNKGYSYNPWFLKRAIFRPFSYA
jgi:hypothetical protein